MAGPRRYITQFDSATSLVYALARCLRGQPFAGKGIATGIPAWAAGVLNRPSAGLRQTLYAWGGWLAAVPASRLDDIDAEAVSSWLAAQYPAGPFPGAFVGSANGAAMHLAAALGMPWLPQTVLVTPRRRMGADQLVEDLAWGRAPALRLAQRNPDWLVHQMHDPIQDRLMVSRLAYFRLKRRRLGPAYETFLRRSLSPAATMVSVECRLSWPVTDAGPSHCFQVGGLAEIPPCEYLDGSPRVEAFLRREGSSLRRWICPTPTREAPEAEWGATPEWCGDVARFARVRGWRLRRLVFTHPQDVSPFVADLYLWWMRARGLRPQRLLVECFALTEPWWALRTGSVPFWLAFHGDSYALALQRYVDRTAWAELWMILLSNGIENIGFAPAKRWQAILRRVPGGGFLGMDPEKFPTDLASFLRYEAALRRAITERVPPPAPLTIEELDRFAFDVAGRYAVEWIVEEPRPDAAPAAAVGQP